ncbi:MAG TPA: IS66 family transposase [Gammaproteobacteria bacterium]|nr:IS66 family transposase [Gammaproteobacteria bacterium]
MNLRAENIQKILDANAVAQLRSTIDSLEKQLKNAQLKIQALSLELAHHRRLKFGVKSEALSVVQRDLFAEDWASDNGELESAVDVLQPEVRRARVKAGRQALPEHLPRIEHRHAPERCDCATCGQALTLVREEITEQLDVEPARFFVHRHIRPQMACRACETMVAEPAPSSIIEGGMASPGLLSFVLVHKFIDHLPLYRIEQMAARSEVNLARSTLADWVGRCGFALQPLAERLAEVLKQRNCLHADETPVQQLDPGKGKTKRAYIWAYRSNDHDEGPPIAVFDYQESRRGEHAQDFLRDWRGHLMVDDYAGYKTLFANGITELGCMAHARRKFFDLHAANQNPTALEALSRIGELYAIEAQTRECTIEQRKLARREAQEKLTDYKTWLDETRLRVADGSALAKALDYSLKRWPALTRYAHTGHLPIDNNPVENCIRPIAIGKKNWLFAGSLRAGKRAATIQTLFATAKLNGIEPYAWLKDTLEKLPVLPNSRLDELLPIKPQI